MSSLDRVDVLLLLLDRVGVVEAQVAAPAELLRDPEVERDRLGVADVEVAVRLGREAGDDLRDAALAHVGGDDLADEIASLGSGWAVGAHAAAGHRLEERSSARRRVRARWRRSSRDLAVQRLQRCEVDLGERRERLDRVAQHVERHARADRERRLLQPLARLRAERVGAGQPLAVAEQRQEPVALGVGARVRGGLRDLRTPARSPLKRASVAPTDAACGSVNTTRGTAS